MSKSRRTVKFIRNDSNAANRSRIGYITDYREYLKRTRKNAELQSEETRANKARMQYKESLKTK